MKDFAHDFFLPWWKIGCLLSDVIFIVQWVYWVIWWFRTWGEIRYVTQSPAANLDFLLLHWGGHCGKSPSKFDKWITLETIVSKYFVHRSHLRGLLNHNLPCTQLFGLGPIITSKCFIQLSLYLLLGLWTRSALFVTFSLHRFWFGLRLGFTFVGSN